MHTSKLIKIGLWSIAAAAALVALSFGARSRNVERRPSVFLWAWERPEKLDFIDPQKIGVAFLAKTITLSSDRVLSRPRLQPLTVPPATAITAVVRIEADRLHPATLANAQMIATSVEVLKLARLSGVSQVQIDFDATKSERDFYRDLIYTVRRQLPAATSLSITALASWCRGDDWLSSLPIDEAVPMLFRMGIEQRQVASQMQSAIPFNARPCQSSAGISTDEPINFDTRSRRLYIFNPHSWTPTSVANALERYQR